LELCQSSEHELLVQMFADEKEDGSNSKTTVGGQFKVFLQPFPSHVPIVSSRSL
jgi:hypothetical protein